MKYRRLGKTGLNVSEIGFGGEWLDGKTLEEGKALAEKCEAAGINIVDCWMSDPKVRSNLGNAIKNNRDRWIIQGHIGSTWSDGQYVRSRDVNDCRIAFNDLLERLGTDHVELGMIHYVDTVEDWNNVINGEYLQYVYKLKETGKIRHIGLSTHNPVIGKLAVESGIAEMIMFSVNPAFDMLPANDDIDSFFKEETYSGLTGQDPERAGLYRLCEQRDIGITVMKPFEGGRLLDEKASPFKVALTPVQCIHYALTRPAVAAVMCGYGKPEHIDDAVKYETATDEEKDYATVLATAPAHAYDGLCTYCGHCKPCPVDIDIAMVNKLYDLATMQDEVPASIKEHYNNLKVKASECLECNSCEERCPFHVSIAERMQAAAELFK